MIRITTSLFFISLFLIGLLMAASAEAASGTLNLTSIGSGGMIGKQQIFTATVVNSGGAPLTPKVCIVYNSYKNYLTLQKNIPGSQSSACTYLSELAPGKVHTISWTFIGKKATPSPSPQFEVNLYGLDDSGNYVYLTNKKLAYVVRNSPPALKITTLAPTREPLKVDLGDVVTANYRISNVGGSSAPKWWMCFARSSNLLPVPAFSGQSKPACARGGTLYSGRSQRHRFYLRAIRPGRGRISLRAGNGRNYSNRLSLKSITFIIPNYAVRMQPGNSIKANGKQRTRQMVVTNTGESTPILSACVQVQGGKLLRFENQKSRCFLIGNLGRSRSTNLDLTVSSPRARATVTVSVPKSKARTFAKTMAFGS